MQLRGFVTPAIICAAVAASVSATAQRINTRAELNTLLGGSRLDEDFEQFSIAAGTSANLDVFELSTTTVANGQGPGLVKPNAVYSDASSTRLQWIGAGFQGIDSKTLMANGTGGTIVIRYAQPVTVAGFDIRTFTGISHGFARVYDPADVQIGELHFHHQNGGSEFTFFGWRASGGIGRMTVQDVSHTYSAGIDNHAYSAVPEPATVLTLLGALGVWAKRKRVPSRRR